LAISKQRKEELVAQYIDWVNRSRACILTEYVGLSVKDIEGLRTKTRDAGGEFHIVKNTLGKVAFEKAGFPMPEDHFVGSTAIAFAFEDAPAMVEVITEFAKESDFVKIKGGYLDGNPISLDEIKALAELPPLPVMRAHLLGTIAAPATKLARTLAEPARQVAAVLKAYSENDSTPATA
jgi:large subunit ribosomal protein L10